MATADTYVRAPIDAKTKERAADALESMGLSISRRDPFADAARRR